MSDKYIEQDVFEEDNIEEVEKEVKRLSTFILENKKVITTIGAGVGIYLLGRRKGFSVGYVKGYSRCFSDIVDTAVNRSK